MVFKKDLTPIGRGGITKHRGKGAAVRPDMPMQRALNRYPKPLPAPPPGPAAQMGSPVGGAGPPPGLRPGPPLPEE